MTTPGMIFDEVNQNEVWQNGVARELNVILKHAEHLQVTACNPSDVEASEAMLSIVDRVQEFEEIETA